MSETMAEKKALELKEMEEKEERLNKEAEDLNKEVCPHCGAPMASFPYAEFHPVLFWTECAVCGVVFCPKAIRNKKIKRATQAIEKPEGLVTPHYVSK